MSKPIIEVQGISKCYQLGTIGATRLRDDVERFWHKLTKQKAENRKQKTEIGNGGIADTSKFPLSTLPISALPPSDEFWALRDVSFEVQPGEIVGIIGRNGAGKSTLLKILSRITEPTSGEIIMRGRVASLLEVGTGFHGDLTGRENIFLNGAILGMSKAEIRSKLDEIIAFAEIEKFIDTPVKRYSSGMYVRLAFAVAAHLEPEILIVDEVLAVGDAEFQKKCLGKMKEVSAGNGRTVLFVSHNMAAVEALCGRAILLQGGGVIRQGSEVRAITRDYLLQSKENVLATEWLNPGQDWKNDWFSVERFSLRNAGGKPLQLPARNDQEIWVEIEGNVTKPDPGLQIGYGIFHSNGSLLYWSTNRDTPRENWQEFRAGRCILRCRLPKRYLNEGRYKIDLFLGLYHRQWICEPGVMGPGLSLEIFGGLSDSPYWVEARPGLVGPVIAWSVEQNQKPSNSPTP